VQGPQPKTVVHCGAAQMLPMRQWKGGGGAQQLKEAEDNAAGLRACFHLLAPSCTHPHNLMLESKRFVLVEPSCSRVVMCMHACVLACPKPSDFASGNITPLRLMQAVLAGLAINDALQAEIKDLEEQWCVVVFWPQTCKQPALSPPCNRHLLLQAARCTATIKMFPPFSHALRCSVLLQLCGSS